MSGLVSGNSTKYIVGEAVRGGLTNAQGKLTEVARSMSPGASLSPQVAGTLGIKLETASGQVLAQLENISRMPSRPVAEARAAADEIATLAGDLRSYADGPHSPGIQQGTVSGDATRPLGSIKQALQGIIDQIAVDYRVI